MECGYAAWYERDKFIRLVPFWAWDRRCNVNLKCCIPSPAQCILRSGQRYKNGQVGCLTVQFTLFRTQVALFMGCVVIIILQKREVDAILFFMSIKPLFKKMGKSVSLFGGV